MVDYVTQYKFAQICGTSRQAIAKAVKENRVVKTKSGIDPDNPINVYFKTLFEARKAEKEAAVRKKKVKPVKVKTGAPPEEPPPDSAVSSEPDRANFDMFQKVYEETRLKKIQADTAVLKYAEHVGASVDVETLKRKMGAFTDFLLTQLVYMPEDISDILWMAAKDSEDPEREIRRLLSKRIEEIVKKAKAATAELEPPDRGVKYVMFGMEEES